MNQLLYMNRFYGRGPRIFGQFKHYTNQSIPLKQHTTPSTAATTAADTQYVNVNDLPLLNSKQYNSSFLPLNTINTDYYPIGTMEYITYTAIAISSLLLGASIIHNIFKPDLIIDIDEYESKLHAARNDTK